MSNELAETDSPEYKELLARLQPETNLAGSSFGTSRRISIRGAVFRKVINGKEVATVDGRTMDIVIVKAALLSRMYFAKDYVEGESVPPTCWSPDNKIPSTDVTNEGRQSDTCRDCKQNIKGSGQGDSRACRYQQRIAILLVGDDGEGIKAKEIYQLSIPATSIFGSETDKMGTQAYARYLQAHKTHNAAIVTEARFDTDSSTPKLSFKPVRPLTKKELKIVMEMQLHADTEDAIKMDIHIAEGTVETKTSEVKEDSPALFGPEEGKKDKKQEDKEAAEAGSEDLSTLLDKWDD